MRTLALVLLASPVLALNDPSPDRDSQCKVHWQRSSFHPTEDAPEGFPDAARELVAAWSPLARELGYRMDVSDDARVMSLSSARFNRSVKRESRLIEDTLEAFDALLPAPAEERAEEQAEEQEAPFVLLRVHDRADYAAILDSLAERHPYLAPWTGTAGALGGFGLREPLCAAILERDAGSEQRPHNELVNRLVNGLTFTRFGEAPHWLSQGIAWHVELDVCGSIHCFPGRAGFVGVGEHGGWADLLKRTYGKRDGLALECADFAAWKRGEWSELQAGMAWGLVGYMAEYRPGALSPILDDLGRYHAQHGRVVHDDGSWERIPGYEVPATVQQHVFYRHLEGDLFAECTRSFQLGKRYRPRPLAR